MTRFASWLHWPRLLPSRQPPPLPVRVPPPPLEPAWGPVWVLEAARRVAAELGPHEEPQVLRLTVQARDGAYVALDIGPGEHWPERRLLAMDGNGELRPVVVPDTVAGAEEWE